jgi:hypothetical protein
MTESKELFELYNIMEEKLDKLSIDFDEFTVLYKAFRSQLSVQEPKETPVATPPNPFPWVKAAGAGWK